MQSHQRNPGRHLLVVLLLSEYLLHISAAGHLLVDGYHILDTAGAQTTGALAWEYHVDHLSARLGHTLLNLGVHQVLPVLWAVQVFVVAGVAPEQTDFIVPVVYLDH